MCLRSGFFVPGEHANVPYLVPVFVPREHPKVPSFRFSFRGNVRQTTLLENHPLPTPEKNKHRRVLSGHWQSHWLKWRQLQDFGQGQVSAVSFYHILARGHSSGTGGDGVFRAPPCLCFLLPIKMDNAISREIITH